MQKTWLAALTLWTAMGVEAGEPARLTLLLVNQAQVPAKPLQEMLDELGGILAQAGIGLETVDCPFQLELPRPAACSQPLRPDRVVLQFISGQPTRRIHAVGTTTLRPEQNTATIVIYAGLAQDLAQSTGWSWHELLSHLAAHELGHALLQDQGHSRAGVMRAVWSPAELVNLRHPQLLFDSAQATRMRQHLASGQVLAQSIPVAH
ncbi:MAG: hypothetical protein HY821_25795 [Acidobacteria bacterium]|nr:hypothetical protein [Acidobacteriota bacterium]